MTAHHFVDADLVSRRAITIERSDLSLEAALTRIERRKMGQEGQGWCGALLLRLESRRALGLVYTDATHLKLPPDQRMNLDIPALL